jgi:polyhydroxyalkanoate depolymerase
MTEQLAADRSAPTVDSSTSEHSVPLFWPMAAAANIGSEALALMRRNLDYVAALETIDHPPPPAWATPNRVRLDLATMYLREFSDPVPGAIPVLIDAPYAGHSATIADYDQDQSLVQTMLASGAPHVLVTDWKPATTRMRYFDIDTYLAALNVVVDDLGGKVHLVGLCQGGWLSAMYAARFPGKVQSLVCAGSPLDTDAGDGPIKQLAHRLPLSTYTDMVELGQGLMPGSFMLTGWKNMHPVEQYENKYLALYRNIEDKNFLQRTQKFESWYENAIALPGAYYLQAIQQLFKENRFAKGEFIALGRQISLRDITVPLYLLAGEEDDITTHEQVFGARALVGTPDAQVTQQLVPGGHIGLFMGRQTLRNAWPAITRWIVQQDG